MSVFPPTHLSHPRERSVSARANLRRITTAWLFGAVWMALCSGTPWIRFSEEMGFGDKGREFAWGLLTAMPFLATFFQLLGSYWIERTQRRKGIFFLTNIAHRCCWTIIGVLPFLLFSHRGAALVAVLVMCLIQAVGAHMAVPAWTSWMADVIPPRIRGRYFGIRARVCLISSLLAALAAGWLLNAANVGILRLPYPRQWNAWAWLAVPFHISPLHLCSIFFIVGTVFGVIDILYFIRVPDRPTRRVERVPGLREIFGPPLRNPQFVRFLVFYSVFWIGAPGVGYYIWLNVLKNLHVSDLRTQLMFMVFPPLGSMLIAPTWGRLIERVGRKTVWMLSMTFPAVLPACWIFVRPEYWWIGIGIQVLGDSFWCGVELCNFNNLLRLADGQKGSSSYQAIFALAIAAAGTISGLLFAGLAEVTKNFHWQVGGFSFTYVAILFATSSLIRTGAYVFLLPRVHDEGRKSVPVALGHVFDSLYDTILAAASFPLRLLGIAGRNGHDDEPDGPKG